jgi:hypothetical protein
MSVIKERYSLALMAADETRPMTNGHLSGFLAKTSGTISLVDGLGVLQIDAVPVTAGVYLPLPGVFTPGNQAVVTLAGGASGTLFI